MRLYRLVLTSAIAVSIATVPLRAQAANPPDVEVVLVPLSVESAAGAFGTSWTTEFSAYHDSDLPPAVVGYDNLGQPIGLSARHTYSLKLFTSGPLDPPGVLLYVTRPGAADTHYDLRVRNGATGVQTTVPVIREPDLIRGRVILVRIPGGTVQRRMLRIYAPLSQSPTSARVTMFEEFLGTKVAEAYVTLIASDRVEVVAGIPFRIHPTAVQVSLESLFPTIANYQSVTAVVEMVEPNVPFWAFVAATNNTTQEVSLMLPN